MGPRHQEPPTRNRPLDWKGLLGFGFSTKVGECRDSEGESSTHTNTQTHTDGDSPDGQPRQTAQAESSQFRHRLIAYVLPPSPPPPNFLLLLRHIQIRVDYIQYASFIILTKLWANSRIDL